MLVVQLDQVSVAARMLDELEHAARDVARREVPRLMAGNKVHYMRDQARHVADHDALRAVEALEAGNFAPGSADAIRDGAALLRDGMNRFNYRGRAHRFVGIIDDVRARNAHLLE